MGEGGVRSAGRGPRLPAGVRRALHKGAKRREAGQRRAGSESNAPSKLEPVFEKLRCNLQSPDDKHCSEYLRKWTN